MRGRHLRWCLTTAARLEPAEATPARASTRSPTTCGPGSAGPPASRTSGSTPTSWPCAWPSSPSPGGCRARPSGGTRRRRRWRPIPPKRPGPFTSERPWPGAGRRATRRFGCTAPPPRRLSGPVTGGVPPSSSPPRPSSSSRTGHHVRAGAARRGQALLDEARTLAFGDPYVEAADAHRHRLSRRARPAVGRAHRTRRRAGPPGGRRPFGELRPRLADRRAARARRVRGRRRHRPTSPRAAHTPGPRGRDGVGVHRHAAHGAAGVRGRRRPRGRPPLRAAAARAAVLPRDGSPGRRLAAHDGGPGRRLRRGGRAGRPVPAGMDRGRPATRSAASPSPPRRRPWCTASAATTRRAANGSTSSPRCGGCGDGGVRNDGVHPGLRRAGGAAPG